jgi:hypothetical protein
MKRIVLAGVSLFCLGLSAVSALAADIVDPASCTISGLVSGGGLYDSQIIGYNFGNAGTIHWGSAFGEAALDYVCGTWGAQLDGAAYGFWANPRGFDQSIGQGHVGVDAFWRDADRGAIGLSASRIFQSYDDRSFSGNGAMWRLGGFGELYAGDMFTLGAGAYYLNGRTAFFDKLRIKGFEGDVFAKFYPMENLALSVRGDLLSARLNSGFGRQKLNGHAISAEVEYLIPDTALSLFAGGRYAKRNYRFTSVSNIYYTDRQAFIGARFALGGATPSSLRDRDRQGSFDNTSVFQEKLPNLFSEAPFD